MNNETLPAEVQDLKDYLNEQADEEPEAGFMQIKILHQGGLFQSTGFGNGAEFSGTILAMDTVRALWAPKAPKSAGEKALVAFAGTLPLCSSRRDNMKAGVGELPKVVDEKAHKAVKEALNPVLEVDCICENCAWSQWGSDWQGGRGQQCRLGKRFLIYDMESNTAAILSISPTSLKSWRNYRGGIPGGHFSMVKTKFTLEPKSGESGNYCIVRFTMVEPTQEEVFLSLSKEVAYKGGIEKQGIILINEFRETRLEREEEFDEDEEEAKEADDF